MEVMDYLHKIILLCKTYRGDVNRAKNLYDSIKKHNKDNLPFYILIPKSDSDVFENAFGVGGYSVIYEEDLNTQLSTQSHFTQQLYKMEFYKTKVAENYFTIDSDMYFIKDFYAEDFISTDQIPYITIHECKDFLEYSELMFGDNRARDWFKGERVKIMEVFGRKGKLYDYSGSAILYVSSVFKALYENYCIPNNLTFLDLLSYSTSENTWYGEYILYSDFKHYPSGPMFKTFHHPWQYSHSKQLGITEQMLAENYLGITLQSNWGAPLKY